MSTPDPPETPPRKGTPVRRAAPAGATQAAAPDAAGTGARAAAAARSRTATHDKRAAAAAPSTMRTVKAMEGMLGENRRLAGSLDALVESEMLGGGDGRPRSRTAGQSSGLAAEPNRMLRSVDPSVSAGKVVASTNTGRMAQARHAQASASFSTAMAQFGISPEFDHYDTLDLMAQHLIEFLQSNVYGFANLTKYERNILYRYFHRTNPVIARILDLHTDLPLSKARLQAPQNVPEIVRDYVMQFFERVFAKLNVNEIMREMVLTQYVHGEAHVQVDDFYNAEADRILQDIEHLEEKVYTHNEGDLKYLQAVERAYASDPLKVSLKDRFKYMEMKFSNFFDGKYQGPAKLSVLKFWNMREHLENEDIAFEAIRYNVSDSYRRLRDMGYGPAELVDLGYSEGFVELQKLDPDAESYTIDNDVYSGLPFIFAFRRPDSTSLILRILNQATEWDAAQRAVRAKIESLGKLGRIISAEGASAEQVAELKVEVDLMLEDPNHAIVTNFEVTWAEVNSFIKEELNEMIARMADLKVDIAMGAGIPDSLLSGDSAYSGDNVKLDLLNTYYLSFNQRLQNVIEEKLLKPIALRKGFVTIDEWGNPTLIYPKLTFSRIGLRDSGTMETLFQLYQKSSLPVSIILDALNLDAEDVKRGVEKDAFTVNDPNMNGLIQEVLNQSAADIYQESTVKERIMDSLKLHKRFADESSTTDQDQSAEGGAPAADGSGPTTGGGSGGGGKSPHTAPKQLPVAPPKTPEVAPPSV